MPTSTTKHEMVQLKIYFKVTYNCVNSIQYLYIDEKNHPLLVKKKKT